MAFGTRTRDDEPNNDKKKKQEPEMSKTRDEERARIKRERDKEAGERVATLVSERIKMPDGFRKIEGHLLFANRYRVNVFVKNDEPHYNTGSLRIGDSFYVLADGDQLLSVRRDNKELLKPNPDGNASQVVKTHTSNGRRNTKFDAHKSENPQ